MQPVGLKAKKDLQPARILESKNTHKAQFKPSSHASEDSLPRPILQWLAGRSGAWDGAECVAEACWDLWKFCSAFANMLRVMVSHQQSIVVGLKSFAWVTCQDTVSCRKEALQPHLGPETLKHSKRTPVPRRGHLCSKCLSATVLHALMRREKYSVRFNHISGIVAI